jgi:acyl-coenzyme A thioesterase PaaI-like protein
VAMEMKVNYLSPVSVGDVLISRCRAIKEGKRTTVCIIEVHRGKELVAYFTATAFNIIK